MSRTTDRILAQAMIDFLTRCREQRLEEYAKLTEDETPLNRDLRLKKSGAIDELANLRTILNQVLDET